MSFIEIDSGKFGLLEFLWESFLLKKPSWVPLKFFEIRLEEKSLESKKQWWVLFEFQVVLYISFYFFEIIFE